LPEGFIGSARLPKGKPGMNNDRQWVGLTDTVNPEDLQRHGPTIPVRVGPANGEAEHSVLAQVDTGASHSAISPRLAAFLGVRPTREVKANHPVHEPVLVDVFRCSLALPNGTVLEADCAVLPNLIHPHDVLIGRDILAICRLSIDFVSGEWSLSLFV
jgi:hypothetical protein